MRLESRRIALASLTSIALATSLSMRASAQEDPNAQSDAQIADQLQGARGGDQFPLNNVNPRIYGRFPWIGGEADLALIENGNNDILGMLYQIDCGFDDVQSRGLLKPVFVPRIPRLRLRGIYESGHRLDSIDIEVKVPEEFPLMSISKALHITDGEINVDCQQVSAEDDLIALAQRINRNLAPTARTGGRTIGSVIRAFIGGLLGRN